MANNIYREITPYSDAIDRWNNVTINAGASQSTLQDIKLPECAGCFGYFNSSDLSSSSSNRFIYWRTSHDVIELTEISLDVDLKSNQLRLRFQNTPILRGLSFHENRDEVILLIATVSAIHKLSFPHPKRLERELASTKKREKFVPSVFHDTTEETLRSRSCFFVLNHVSLGNPLPHTSCSWLESDGSAAFVLANSAGSVLMMIMSNQHGIQITRELMKATSLFRLKVPFSLSGFVPSIIKSNKTEMVLDILCHQIANDILIVGLFTDLQLRVWSRKREECIFVDSIINYDTGKQLISGNFTAHQCQLRKSPTDEDFSFNLGVFIPVSHKKIFYLFRPYMCQDSFNLGSVSTLHQSQNDLVDFCLDDSRIWTLWLNSENEPIVLTALIDPSVRELHERWMQVDLEPRVSRFVDFNNSKPHDVYLKEIFKVGRFLPSTISKAITIYNSVNNTNIPASSSLKVDDLKKRVTEAVENSVALSTGDMEETESEYIEISAKCWDRFFSYCIQYHEVGMKPLGMAVDFNTGFVIIIKKNFYSLLCPCDPLQYFISPKFRSDNFYISFLDKDDQKLYHNLKSVLKLLDLIRESVDDKLLLRFEDKLYNSYSPIKYASEICKGLDFGTDSSFQKSLLSMLPSTQEIVPALNFFISKLDLLSQRDLSEAPFTKYPLFADSSSGIGALCSGLAHFTRQRFEFCRDLLLLEVILWDTEAMENDQLDNLMMQSTIIPSTVSLVRSYFVILWCTQCDCVPVSISVQDAAFKQFCVLELPEYTNSDLTTIKQGYTVSQLFFQGEGGNRARKMLSTNLGSYTAENWISLFPSLTVISAALLWPLEGNMFSEFLFSKCQFYPLQEYDNLLQNLCTWNKQYLNFLVASSYLILGDHLKALNLFLNVSKEIVIESYLCNRLLKGKYNSNSSVLSLFCMRVIQMFEQFSLSDCIVKLVTPIIAEVEKSDPHVPIFYSVLFKHHLNLGNSEQAFATLIKNPDSSRRKDCLRQLVVNLCEGRKFQKIIELSYLAYDEEIISILESRARCSDLSKNTSFYEVLYSLHIHHKKFRKAAAVMYELALRFSREVMSVKGLSKQASYFLSAINCLYFAEKEYAWIVKPVLSVEENTDEERDTRDSSKRNFVGEEFFHVSRPTKIEVLTLEDIRQEYNLVQARLELALKHQNASNLVITPLSPEETVALLLNASLFDSAIQVCKSFSLSLVQVFDAIAYRCLTTSLKIDVYSTNGLEKNVYMKADVPEDLINSKLYSSQQMWNILEKYLAEYELPGKSELHKCVTEKFLSYGAALPAWLKLSYQKRNFTELMSLFVCHGQLEDALCLMVKYIKAVLGVHKEDFDLKFSLNYNSPAVWLPHTYIDILLDASSVHQLDVHYKSLRQELLDTYDEYKKAVESETASKLAK